jgi:poly(ADP-ribose) glycohydrolase
MTSKQWLTIEDWIECKLPLCPMDVKHESRLENAPPSVAQVIFSQSAIGSSVLLNGTNQETNLMISHPELLIILLFTERLEDNEALLVENVMQMTRIIDIKQKAIIERLQPPKLKSTMICMDAEDYHKFPITQFEEDNTLRELNKCLLAFRQNTCTPMSSKLLRILSSHSRDQKGGGRLSPIGRKIYKI